MVSWQICVRLKEGLQHDFRSWVCDTYSSRLLKERIKDEFSNRCIESMIITEPSKKGLRISELVLLDINNIAMFIRHCFCY